MNLFVITDNKKNLRFKTKFMFTIIKFKKITITEFLQ